MPTGRQVAQPETTQGGTARKRQRVLSGMRPTGKLHIGNYFGALPNWLKLQADDSNDCYFFVADWHSLTSEYADASQIAQNTIEIATDFLAAGLDPNKPTVTIFQQSQVPEHAELHLLLSMVTPLGWLERVPTYKEALEQIKEKDLHTYGFLGYPVLQTADIVIYGEPGVPLVVPVGEDQVAHVELSREIVRRFNTHSGFEISGDLFLQENENSLRAVASILSLPEPPKVDEAYWRTQIRREVAEVGLENFLDKLRPGNKESGNNFARPDRRSELALSVRPEALFSKKESLVEPQVMLTKTPRIPGTDGRKMSKSYNNFIGLGEDDESIRKKTKIMLTDPKRTLRTIPGDPDVCPVFSWHKLFSDEQVQQRIRRDCTTAAIGCVDCKQVMADGLIKWIEPVRARRKVYESKPGEVLEILDAGSKKARAVAQSTMARVREAVFGWNKARAAVSGGKR
jgi:tryptophanyl-tRNA synthetase